MKHNRILLASVLAMIFGSVISCSDSQPVPEKPVPIKTLVGTWQWQWHDRNFMAPKPSKPSLMILRDDGCYEIHNPPDYISVPTPKYARKDIPLENQAKYYHSSSYNTIIVGKWKGDAQIGIDDPQKIKEAIILQGLEFPRRALGGKTAPFVLYHYWTDPDLQWSEKWNMVSQKTKCPHCPADVFDEKHLFTPEELKKSEQEREKKLGID